MAIDLAKLVVKLEAQSAQYIAELEKANKKLDSFAKKSELSLGKVAKATAGIALGVGTALTALGLSAAKNIDEFGKLSQKLGVGTEALSQLSYAAEISDTNIEGLTKGMSKLSKAAVEASTGSKELQSLFKDLGLSIKEADGSLKSSDRLLLELSDRFEQFQDGPAKSTAALKLLGKAGLELVPFLNQGSAAIKELMEESKLFGQTVTDEAAAAADQFNDNLDRLRLAMKGVVNQAVQRVLPAFTELSDSFIDGAKKSGEFDRSVEILAAGFKVIASAAIVVKTILFSVGTALGALTAAAAKAFEGVEGKDFLIPGAVLYKVGKNIAGVDGALANLKGSFGDVFDAAKGDLERLNDLWQEDDNRLQEVIVTVKKIKSELKITDAGLAEKIAKESEKAVTKLKELDAELKEQVATFDQGSLAVLEYSLNFGKLAVEVGKAGDEGQALRESILAAGVELENLKNQDAITSLDIQILQLTGHFKEAAAAAFDLQNKALKASFEQTGNQEGLDRLNKLRELTTAQAEFNDLQAEAQRIQDKLARTEQSIQNQVIVGASTEIDAMNATSEARKKALEELEAIRMKMQEIAEASGNPELVANLDKFGTEIDDLAAHTDLLAEKIGGDLKAAGADFFKDIITGSKSAKDAVLDFIARIGEQFAALIAQNFAEQLFGGLTGTSGGGGGTNYIAAIASLFGGSMDSGGQGKAGRAYMIGTGAQPEMFVPGMTGRFIPRAQWQGMGGGVTQHFAIQAPQGTVSRQTQLQIGAEAARGISTANRRNNR